MAQVFANDYPITINSRPTIERIEMTHPTTRPCSCPEPYINHIDSPSVITKEYEPSCPVHSYHLYNPRTLSWQSSGKPHTKIRIYDEIEVCNTCHNSDGYPVAWELTWHHSPSRGQQHAWAVDNESGEPEPLCGDPSAVSMGRLYGDTLGKMPVCVRCYRLALAKARAQERAKR